MRHDGLLHEIIDGRMRGKLIRGKVECYMIWQMMAAMMMMMMMILSSSLLLMKLNKPTFYLPSNGENNIFIMSYF